jgi:arylsulfatase A-like enzyme
MQDRNKRLSHRATQSKRSKSYDWHTQMVTEGGMPGNEYADGMLEHDGDVGKRLKTLDDLKITDNTIVVYTTDNGMA